MSKKLEIGVLASQGAFIEHVHSLQKLNVEASEVRLPAELKGLDGLILPGGESTTISRLLNAYDLMQEIADLGKNGFPLFGTCAGMILMAKNVSNNGKTTLGLIDVAVKRNAFGRQVDSFETDLKIPVLGKEPFHAVFIRAPLIESCAREVEVLARLEDNTIVAARQDNMLVTAFHPELTEDVRFHRYFLDVVNGKYKK
jgi:pyridoxal 5'-phosphate synthase pdxT subunit